MSHLPLVDLFERAPSPVQTLVGVLVAVLLAVQLLVLIAMRLGRLAGVLVLTARQWVLAVRQLRGLGAHSDADGSAAPDEPPR